MAGRRPDFFEPEQFAVDQRHRRLRMGHRGNAADRKPGPGPHEIGIRTTELADQRGNLLLVDAPIARGDHQHRAVVFLAPEDDALGHLPHQDAQRIGGLLCGACGIVQHLRQVRVAAPLQFGSHTLYALGQVLQFSSTHSRCLQQVHRGA